MSKLTIVNVTELWQSLSQPNANILELLAPIDDMDMAGFQLMHRLVCDGRIALSQLNPSVAQTLTLMGCKTAQITPVIMPTPAPSEILAEVTEPEVEVTEPTDEVAEPTDEVAEPTDEVAEPTDEVAEPTDEVAEPTDEVAEPTDEVTEPTDEVAEPTDEVAEPTDEVAEPTDEVAEPTDEVAEPTDEVAEPTDEVAEPTDEVAEPTDEVAEPTDEVAEPTDEVAEPTDEVAEPTDEVAEPEEPQTPSPSSPVVHDLSWKEIRNTIMTMNLAVAQIDLSMNEGEFSVETLIDSFNFMNTEIDRINTQLQRNEIDIDDVRRTLTKQSADLTEKADASIIAFQFYDKLSQRLHHVSQSLSALTDIISCGDCVLDETNWTKFMERMSKYACMREESELFELIFERGYSANTAVGMIKEILSDRMQEAREKHKNDAPNFEDDIELF